LMFHVQSCCASRIFAGLLKLLS